MENETKQLLLDDRNSKAEVKNTGSGCSVDTQYDGEQNDTVERQGWKKNLVYLIFFVYFYIYMSALMCMTEYSYFAVAHVLYPNGTDHSNCTSEDNSPTHRDIQAEASVVQIYFSIAAGIPAVISNVVFGSLTDKFGRKPLFFMSITGVLIRLVITTLMMYYHVSIYYFTIAYVVDGVFGSFAGMEQAAFSFVADITSSGNDRSLRLTILEIIISLSGTTGSFITGFQIDVMGFLWTFVYFSVILVFCVLITTLLPETVCRDEIKNPTKSIKSIILDVFRLYYVNNSDGTRWRYTVAITAFSLTMVVFLGRQPIEILVQMGSPFCWSSEYIGYFNTIRAGLQIVFGIVIVRYLSNYGSDEAFAIWTSLLALVSLVVQGLADSDATFFSAAVIGASAILAIPMIKSIMSKLTPANQQGVIFASIGAMETVSNMLSTIIESVIYNQTVNIYRGIVFFVMAAFELVVMVLMLLLIIIPRCSRNAQYVTIKH